MSTPPNTRSWWDRTAIAVAALTIVAGLGQGVVPGLALRGLGVEPTPPLLLFFILTSALVTLFGAGLLREALHPSPERRLLLLGGLQKIIAAATLTVGLLRSIMSGPVLAVVIYDGLCGLFLLILWRRSRE